MFCLFLTNFRAPFFKEIPFFLWGDPLQNPRRTPAPEYCISSRKRRSFEVRGRGGIQEGGGRWGGGKKKEKRTQKVLRFFSYFRDFGFFLFRSWPTRSQSWSQKRRRCSLKMPTSQPTQALHAPDVLGHCHDTGIFGFAVFDERLGPPRPVFTRMCV